MIQSRTCSLRRVSAVLALVWIASAAGCLGESDATSISDTSTSAEALFEFGEIDVTAGGVTLVHAFEVPNHSPRALEVRDIRTSCGCLEARLNEHVIPPGQSSSLWLRIDVKGAGFQTQAATLVTADGRLMTYRVTAYAVVPKSLTVIPSAARVGSDDRLSIRLYYVDSDGDELTEPAELIAPEDVVLEFANWHTLERRESGSSRPVRQVANAVLNFGGYQGEFPVEIEIRTSLGTTKRFVIYGQESNK